MAQYVTFLRNFGLDTDSSGKKYGQYKILISTALGSQYFVWYTSRLGAYEGNSLIIGFDDYGNWATISNPESGDDAEIMVVEQII